MLLMGAMALTLASCSKEDYNVTPTVMNEIKYTEAFVEQFGTIDPNQNWDFLDQVYKSNTTTTRADNTDDYYLESEGLIMVEDLESYDFDFNDIVLGVYTYTINPNYNGASLARTRAAVTAPDIFVSVRVLAAGGYNESILCFKQADGSYKELGEVHDLLKSGAKPGNIINAGSTFDSSLFSVGEGADPYYELFDNYCPSSYFLKFYTLERFWADAANSNLCFSECLSDEALADFKSGNISNLVSYLFQNDYFVIKTTDSNSTSSYRTISYSSTVNLDVVDSATQNEETGISYTKAPAMILVPAFKTQNENTPTTDYEIMYNMSIPYNEWYESGSTDADPTPTYFRIFEWPTEGTKITTAYPYFGNAVKNANQTVDWTNYCYRNKVTRQYPILDEEGALYNISRDMAWPEENTKTFFNTYAYGLIASPWLPK